MADRRARSRGRSTRFAKRFAWLANSSRLKKYIRDVERGGSSASAPSQDLSALHMSRDLCRFRHSRSARNAAINSGGRRAIDFRNVRNGVGADMKRAWRKCALKFVGMGSKVIRSTATTRIDEIETSAH